MSSMFLEYIYSVSTLHEVLSNIRQVGSGGTCFSNSQYLLSVYKSLIVYVIVEST